MGVEFLGGGAVKEEAVVDEVEEDVAGDFSQVHSRDHLFEYVNSWVLLVLKDRVTGVEKESQLANI